MSKYKYKVRMWALHNDEVTRIELKTIDDIPDFEKENIALPCDLFDRDKHANCDTTGCTLNPGQGMICFKREDGYEMTLSLNPPTRNGIHFKDEGDAFDESDWSKSYFYFLQNWHCDEWVGEVELDGAGEILPEKLCIAFRHYRDKDGQRTMFLIPSSLTYDGQPVGCENMGCKGACSETYWILSAGERQEVFPIYDDGAEHPSWWTLDDGAEE
jgi:hypothetical protein